MFRDNASVPSSGVRPLSFPAKSVTIYQSTLLNIPEEKKVFKNGINIFIKIKHFIKNISYF